MTSSLAGRRTLPVEVRFAAQHEKGGPDECWLWTGSTTKDERGRIRVSGKPFTASRVALILAKGNPPRDDVPMVARHHCDNPRCVNPAHLDWGTYRDNSQDAVKRKRHSGTRKTHCKRGHLLDGDNLSALSQNPLGLRVCKACKRINAARRRGECR